jgi:hypothetical protein
MLRADIVAALSCLLSLKLVMHQKRDGINNLQGVRNSFKTKCSNSSREKIISVVIT